MLLEVSLAGRDELHGGELEAAALEARDDLTDETCVRACSVWRFSPCLAKSRWDCSPRWTPSGLRGESPWSEATVLRIYNVCCTHLIMM